MDGYVKVWRNLLEWEWWGSSSHVIVFLTLLLRANYKETKWRGCVIKKGQLLTGRKQISVWCNLSESKTRRILDDLKSTNEITIKTTNKFSIITIVNWENYQDQENERPTKRPANRHSGVPTNDQQTTTSKKAKKDKKKRNNTPEVKNYISDNFSMLSVEIQDWLCQASQTGLKALKDNYYDSSLKEEIERAYLWSVEGGKKHKRLGSFLANWMNRGGHEKKSESFHEMIKRAEEIARAEDLANAEN